MANMTRLSVKIICTVLVILVFFVTESFSTETLYASPVEDYLKGFDDLNYLADFYGAENTSGRLILKRTANFDDIFRLYSDGDAKGLIGCGGKREILIIPGSGYFSGETAEIGFWSDQNHKNRSLYKGGIEKYTINFKLAENRKRKYVLELKKNEISLYGTSSLDKNIMQYFSKITYNNVTYNSGFFKIFEFQKLNNDFEMFLSLGLDFSKYENRFGDRYVNLVLPFINKGRAYGMGLNYTPRRKNYKISISADFINGSTHNDFFKDGIPSLGENFSERSTKNFALNYFKKIKKDNSLYVIINSYGSYLKNYGRLETGVIKPILNLITKSYRYHLNFSQKINSVNVIYNKKIRKTIDISYWLHYSTISPEMPFAYSRETLFFTSFFIPKDITFPYLNMYGAGFEINKNWRKNIDISYSLRQFIPLKRKNKISEISTSSGENISETFEIIQNDNSKSTFGGTFHNISIIYKF